MRAAQAKTRGYKEMLDLHPHLKQRDQKELARIYTSIHNVNPMMAQDPMVAGALIDNIVESTQNVYQGKSHMALLETVKDLSGIRASISAARANERPKTPFGAAFGKATEMLSGRMKEVDKEHGELKHMTDQFAAYKQQQQDLKDRDDRQRDNHALSLATQHLEQASRGAGVSPSDMQQSVLDFVANRSFVKK